MEEEHSENGENELNPKIHTDHPYVQQISLKLADNSTDSTRMKKRKLSSVNMANVLKAIMKPNFIKAYLKKEFMIMQCHLLDEINDKIIDYDINSLKHSFTSDVWSHLGCKILEFKLNWKCALCTTVTTHLEMICCDSQKCEKWYHSQCVVLKHCQIKK